MTIPISLFEDNIGMTKFLIEIESNYLKYPSSKKKKIMGTKKKQVISHGWPTNPKYLEGLLGWSNQPQCLCYGGQPPPPMGNDCSFTFWVPEKDKSFFEKMLFHSWGIVIP